MAATCSISIPVLDRKMDDPGDLVLAMLGLVIAAVMLVAGGLYLVLNPDPIPLHTIPPAVMAPPPTS
jgi:hypothetical protein